MLVLLPLQAPEEHNKIIPPCRAFGKREPRQCQRPRLKKYSGRQSRPSKLGALGIKPPNCSPSFWKGFLSFSRHLGNKATDEDQGRAQAATFQDSPVKRRQ